MEHCICILTADGNSTQSNINYVLQIAYSKSQQLVVLAGRFIMGNMITMDVSNSHFSLFWLRSTKDGKPEKVNKGWIVII